MYELWTAEEGLEMWTFENEGQFRNRLSQLDRSGRKYKINEVNC